MFIKFNNETVRSILKELKEDAVPQWGNLNPVGMVEHLVAAVKMSNGKLKVPVHTPEEKLPKVRGFLYSIMPMPRNVQSDALKPLFPPPGGKPLSEVISTLEKEIEDFYAYHETTPSAENHPVFGPLNKEEWELLHAKHFTHHFVQFRLMAEK